MAREKMTRTIRRTKKGLSYVKKRTKAANIKSSKLIPKPKADDVLAPDKPLVSSDDDIDDDEEQNQTSESISKPLSESISKTSSESISKTSLTPSKTSRKLQTSSKLKSVSISLPTTINKRGRKRNAADKTVVSFDIDGHTDKDDDHEAEIQPSIEKNYSDNQTEIETLLQSCIIEIEKELSNYDKSFKEFTVQRKAYEKSIAEIKEKHEKSLEDVFEILLEGYNDKVITYKESAKIQVLITTLLNGNGYNDLLSRRRQHRKLTAKEKQLVAFENEPYDLIKKEVQNIWKNFCKKMITF
jgi:L-lactate utilization protein LutC